MGLDGLPLASPHIGHILQYDQAIRNLQHRLVKAGTPFRQALEAALSDQDKRCLNFTIAFGMEAMSQPCRNLTAPGLREMYGVASGHKHAGAATKRGATALENGASASAPDDAKRAQKRARKKANAAAKKQAQKSTGFQPAQKALTVPPPPGLAIEDRKDRGGKSGKGGKGGKGAGKPPLPRGIKPKTDDGKLCCFACSKGEKCVETPCRFAHVCWWCHGNHPGGGDDRPNC
jgi:hypothetical protein